jgi:transposase-like protein
MHGYRQVLGVKEGAKEDKESWSAFLRHLKSRGLSGVNLFVSDKCIGLIESIVDFYPDAKWQRCVVHFYRNVFTAVPRSRVKEVAAMLKAIHAQEDQDAADEKIASVVKKLKKMKLGNASKIVEEGAKETLSYYDFPSQLEVTTHKQPAGKAHAGNQTQNARGWSLSGRPICINAGGCKTATCLGHQMGQ